MDELGVSPNTAGGTGDGMIGFSGAGRRTTTRLLDTEFPKYRAAGAGRPRADGGGHTGESRGDGVQPA